MTYSVVTYTGTGITGPYGVTFPYISKDHVKVRVNGVLQTVATNYTWLTDTTISFVVAVAAGATIEFRRESSRASRIVNHQDASNLTEATLDSDALQLFYVAQEAFDSSDTSMKQDSADLKWNALTYAIKNLGAPTAATDAATKSYVDAVIGSSSGAFVQTGTGAVIRTTQEKLREVSLSVADFMTAAEIAGCVAGTVDVTAALRTCYAHAQTLAATYDRVKIDHHNFVMQIFPGTHTVEPAVIGDFNGLSGIELCASGAKFTSPGNFTVDTVRAWIFKFRDCHNIFFTGAWEVDHTGDRYTGGANLTTAMERRGLVWARFIDDCSNIRGHVKCRKSSFGWWFQSDDAETSQATVDPLQARNIVVSIDAYEVGYPVWCNNGGHNLTAYISSDRCGRSCTLQDQIGGHNIVVKSKNHQASADVGIAGASEGGYFKYINTESNTGTELGRCIGVHYSGDSNRTMRGLNIDLQIKSSGTTSFLRGFTLGMAVGGTGTEPTLTQLQIKNVNVTGSIESDSATQQMCVVDFPAVWTPGQNLDNINFRDLTLKGGGSVAFDLRGVKNRASLTNVTADANIQVYGNTVGRIRCESVTCPEMFSDASNAASFNVAIIDCDVTVATKFNKDVARRLVSNTYLAGELHSTHHSRGQEMQSFTLVITNTAGVLQHQIVANIANSGTLPPYASKVTGASAVLANTPTVDAVTNFTSGVGITGNQVVLNTAQQTLANLMMLAAVEYYDGNVVHPRVYPLNNLVNVNGTTLNRLHFRLLDAMTGAAWNINTVNLPAGKSIAIKFMGYLA